MTSRDDIENEEVNVEEKNIQDDTKQNDRVQSVTIKPSLSNPNPPSTAGVSQQQQQQQQSTSQQQQQQNPPKQKVETNVEDLDEDIVITPVMKKSSAGCVPGGFCIIS